MRLYEKTEEMFKINNKYQYLIIVSFVLCIKVHIAQSQVPTYSSLEIYGSYIAAKRTLK